jgi:CHAT domain-containing protein/tetratricopeptide (TPR) repeat protein
MRLPALPSALAVGALALTPHGSGGQPPAPAVAPPPRVLADAGVEDARRFAKSLDAWGAVCGGPAGEAGARRLYARYLELWAEYRFVEAGEVVRALVAARTRMNGEGHFETRNVCTLLETVKHVVALPDGLRAEYVETIKLGNERAALEQRGRYPEAIRLSERILAVRRRVLRPDDIPVDINHHAILLHEATRYAEAEPLFREALEITRRLVGTDHPATAAVCGNLAMTLDKLDRFTEARARYDEAVAIDTRLWGNDHPSTAVAYSNLATHLDRQARYAESEPLLRRVLDIMCRAEGTEGPHALISRSNLAFNLNAQGRYAEAERLYRKVLDSRLEPAGEKYLAAAASAPAQAAQYLRRRAHPDAARSYANLAVNLDSQGRYAAAETLYRQALAIYQALDVQSDLVAMICSSLAVTLNNQGKYEEAEQFYEKAVRIFLRASKERRDREVARVTNNRAANLVSQGKLADAQKLHEEALAIFRDLFGDDHPDVAASYNNLAKTLSARGRHAEAEPLLRKAVEIHGKTLGPNHPHTANSRLNLAVCLHHQGKYAEATPELEAALDLHRRSLGEGHPGTAGAYRAVVINSCARGEYAKAEALAAAAAASFEAARLRISFAGLDRAGPAAELSPLPALAIAAAHGGKLTVAWQALERNLARGLLDDLAAHPLSDGERRREQELLGRVNALDGRVGFLLARGPATDAERHQAERERDAAQAELAQFEADLAKQYGVGIGKVYDLPAVQARLPEDAALLAWVDLPTEPKWHDPKGDHWACLVKRRGDPVWVQLSGSGPKNAWTDEDDQLAARVRRAFAARPDDPRAGWKDLTDRLAGQRLAPLKEHLDGVRHLVVLPSAGMAGVPVGALTDLTVSYAPSGTMFAWLREKRAAAGVGRPDRPLLAFGNPAFKKGGDGPAPLLGTQQELAGIARVFDQSVQFKGPEASEQNLDRLAAEKGGLRRFGYLHFATHGVLDDRRPMRSALLLAQDRLPDPLDRVLGGEEAYDGRLTAERMLRRWKLDAELVTLSACDTGLGKYAGGEGYLGFSQALFVAGARSLVLSLWEVDDAATALLMTRFYENLMGVPEGLPGGPVRPLPKAEALAEAMKWLRDLKPEEVDQLRKDLPARGTRGRIEKRKPTAATAAPSYDHPYYWSGFVLIGDPR